MMMTTTRPPMPECMYSRTPSFLPSTGLATQREARSPPPGQSTSHLSPQLSQASSLFCASFFTHIFSSPHHPRALTPAITWWSRVQAVRLDQELALAPTSIDDDLRQLASLERTGGAAAEQRIRTAILFRVRRKQLLSLLALRLRRFAEGEGRKEEGEKKDGGGARESESAASGGTMVQALTDAL